MALRDDFREAIRTGNASEALLLAMSEALELKITTWVAPPNSPLDASALPGERLRTKINLIEGKIEHEVGDRFIGYAPYRELRDYHHAQVARSPELIRNNLQSLQKLFEVLSALRQQSQSSQNQDSQLPPLELSPLPTLISQPPLSQPDLNLSSTPVIPSLRPTSAPLTPLPSLESSAPAATPKPEAISVPPAPEKPVTDLEIEDWEEAVGIQVTSPFPTSDARPSLEAREPSPEPQEPASESRNLENLSVFPSSLPSLNDEIVTQPKPEEAPPAPPKGSAKQIAPTGSAPTSEVFSEADWAGAKQELSKLETGTPITEIPAVREEPIVLPVSSPASSPPVASPSPSLEFSEEDWGEPIKTETPPQITAPSKIREELIKFPEETGSNGTAVTSSLSSSDRLNSTPNERFTDEEDWGDVSVRETLGQVPTQPLVREEVIGFEDEDWGDVATETPEIQAPTQPLVREEVIGFEDEDWGDVATEAPEIQAPTQPLVREEVIELEDEDWGDIASEETMLDISMQPSRQEEVLDFEEEDWGDLTGENGQSERLEIADESLDESWLDNLYDEEAPVTNARLNANTADELLAADWVDEKEERAWDSETTMLSDLVPDLHFEDEDWGEYSEDDLDADPSVPDLRTANFPPRSATLENNGGEFASGALSSQPEQLELRTENLTFETEFDEDDENWVGLTEDTLTSRPDAPSGELTNAGAEDWRADWLAETQTSESTPSNAIAGSASSDDEWEEFESLDPFANPLEPESLLSDVELEEDWDDFAAEELEPYPNATLLDVDESVLEAFDLGIEESEATSKIPPPNTAPENGKMPPSDNQL